MVSSMRRCPFSENIHRSIQVSSMCRATVWARPHTVSERDACVERAANRAQLGRWEPLVDMMHRSTCLAGDMVQRVEKRCKAQIRHLASPQRFHPLHVERFQGDAIILSAQLTSEAPMKVFSLVRNAFVDTGKMLLGLLAIGGALLLARQLTARLRNRLQTVRERLRCLVCSAITACEVCRQPKIKACAFTCHDSVNGLFLHDAGEVDVQVSESIALDGDGLDGASDLARLRILVDGRADFQSVVVKQFPACLCQSEGFGVADLAKRWSPDASSGCPSLPCLPVRKECLIAFVDAACYLLDGLRTELRPPGVLRQSFQFCEVSLQCRERQMLLVQTIVTLMEGNTMVVYCPTHVNLAMQSLRALAPIDLVHEGLTHRHYCTPYRLACSRIITSSLAVMLMPAFSSSASKRRLASALSRRLIAFGFSIPRVSHIYAVRCTQDVLSSTVVGIVLEKGQRAYIPDLKDEALRALW